MTITPTMMSLPVGRNNSPGRIIPLYADWTRDTVYVADFKAQGASLSLDQVVSVFINNENSDNSVVVSVSGTAIPYTVQSGQVGVFPIYANGLPTVTLTSDGNAGSTTFAFANFGQPLFAYDATQIAQSVKELTLAAANVTSPVDDSGKTGTGKTAVRTFDPALVAAIEKMSAETGLDFHFDGVGNALTTDATLKTTAVTRPDKQAAVAVDIGTTGNVSLNGVATDHYSLSTYNTDGSGHKFSFAWDFGLKGPTYADPRLSFVKDIDPGKFKAPFGGTWNTGSYTTGSLLATFDPRLSFDSTGRLITTLDSVTIDGGSVTVNTKNKYDSVGNLLTADVGVVNLIDNYAFKDAVHGDQLRVGGPSLTSAAGSVAALASEITTAYGGGLKVIPSTAMDGRSGVQPLRLEGQFGALKTNDVYLGGILTSGSQVTKVSGTVNTTITGTPSVSITGTPSVSISGAKTDGTNLMVYSADASAKLQAVIVAVEALNTPPASSTCFSTIIAAGGKRQKVGSPTVVTAITWGIDMNDGPVGKGNKPRWLVFWSSAGTNQPAFATPLAVCGNGWKGAQGALPVNIAGANIQYCSIDDDFPGSGQNTMSYTSIVTLNGHA